MNRQIRGNHGAPGFSLIEALVVISITILLTASLAVFSRSGEKQIAFFREESVLVSSVLRAKGFSIETFQPELEPGFAPPASGGRVCGWGIFFEKTPVSRFVIFTDFAPGGPSAECISADQQYGGAGSNETFEEFLFDSAVAIDCLALNASSGDPCAAPGFERIHVTFIPPDPMVVFTDETGGSGGKEAVIVLRLNSPNQSRTSTVRISEAGQVSVN